MARSRLPRWFYVVVSDGTNLFTVFSKQEDGKYINMQKVKEECEKAKIKAREQLTITNIVEFKSEEDLEDFIS